MQPTPQSPTRLITALVTLMLLVVGHPAQAGLTAAQQAKANAALLGLWNRTTPSPKVSVAEVQATLDNGADINATDATGSTPLMQAASYDYNYDSAKFLVSKGADVNARNNNGWTALINAVNSRSLDCVEMLVAAGADLNAQSDNRESALNECVLGRKGLPILKYLVSKGADVNIRGHSGDTPLMVASLLGNLDCATFLASNGADVNVSDWAGKTALILACETATPKCVYLLISKGANVNIKDKAGKTALMAASQSDVGSAEEVRENKLRSIQETKESAMAARLECVKLLVAAAADVSLKDKAGRTAFSGATNPAIIAILKAAGAKH